MEKNIRGLIMLYVSLVDIRKVLSDNVYRSVSSPHYIIVIHQYNIVSSHFSSTLLVNKVDNNFN